jgi:hypothetical protein
MVVNMGSKQPEPPAASFFDLKKRRLCCILYLGKAAGSGFTGERVPLHARSGQRLCLWKPQPLKRLAKLLDLQ